MIWLLLMLFVLTAPIYSSVMFFPIKLNGKSKKYKFCTIGFYALCAIALFCNMINSIMNFKHVTNDFLGKVITFFAAVAFTVFIYGTVFLLIRQVILWIIYFITKRKGTRQYKIKSRKYINIILVFTFIIGIAGFVNANIVKVKNYEVDVNKSSEKNSYDIVMITDTHIGSGDTKEQIDTVVKQTNEINPDFIFLTGDIIDENSNDENVDYILRSFSSMKSKYGVFAVMGNHEGYRKGESAPLFEKYKITVLRDEVIEIAGITIAGRKDAYDNPMNIQELLDKNKVNNDHPVIALSHEPLDYYALSQAKVDLVFSGHTHGIQFPLSYTFLRMANDMVYGHKKFGDMNAIVSSGAGEWGLHYTLPSGNEIVHVKLNLNK